uniref:Uncharacterized protein n=1 Tax=Hucho hucho TaxID=62062 RepID=A0A4W5QK74_9TELE
MSTPLPSPLRCSDQTELTDRQTAGSGETSQQQQQHRPQQRAKTRRCWSTVTSVGKCLLLIILIPPFLNYASLQREGQLLLPEDGEIIDIGLGQKMHLMWQGQPVVILDAPTYQCPLTSGSMYKRTLHC